MRIPAIAALAALGSVTGAGAATGDIWCYRDFHQARPGHCSFYSARQCLNLARIAGGICEREQAAQEQPAPKAKTDRKATR
jgi:hypothetical protein